MEEGVQGLMKILITGTSSGIGKSTAELFLEKGHEVYGLDIAPNTIENENFHFFKCDVSKKESLPNIKNVEILINNAGTIEEEKAIETNLIGYVNVAEKYSKSKKMKSIINVGSISGRVGLDTPLYASSQGGRIAYTKNLAIRMGKERKIPVNSVSFGAVMSNLEPYLYEQPKLVEQVASENLLHKWIQTKECAEWIYFMAIKNKSMTGQDILIDNGEEANFNFVKGR